MENKGLKSIEMMNDLLVKSEELKKQYKEENKLTKEEMLRKAKKKITDYFNEVLHSMPYEIERIEVSPKLEIILKKESSIKTTTDSWSSKEINATCTIINYNPNEFSGGGDHCVLQSEYEGLFIYHNKLYKPDEKTILAVVKNFDKVKEAAENKIMDRIQKDMDKNAKVLKKENNKIESLKEFLA